MGDVIWGNMPTTLPLPSKKGVNRQFQAQTAKYKKTQYLRNYKSDEDQIREPTTEQQLHFVGGLILSRSNPIWLPAAILKKSI